MTPQQRHIVFATSGSLGDLHPFLALGGELQRRGHRATIATSAIHEPHVLKAGLAFRHMRPDPENTPAFHARFMHPKTGGRFVYRDYLGPAIRASYADLLQATHDAHMLVSQSLMAMAAPLVAAKTGIAWVSVVLQPMSFFSVHERPYYLPLSFLSWMCERSPKFHAQVFHYVRKHTAKWIKPVLDLQQELGVAQQNHPMYEGQHSPTRVMAMFSPLLGSVQPDWPGSVLQTGTALYLPASSSLPAALEKFLEDASAPLAIFTLSSASSNDAGDFYRESLKAASSLGLRALLIMGGLAAASSLPEPLPDWAFRLDYIAFEKVFPYAAVIVHSGGVATSFKSLRSGKPQVIVPHAHDQRDNAMRLSRLGVATMILNRRAGKKTLCKALQKILADKGMQDKAAALMLEAQHENGVVQGCNAIERLLDHV